MIDVSKFPGIAVRKRPMGKGGMRVARVLNGYGAGAQYSVHSNSLNNLARGVVERVLATRSTEGLADPLRPCEGSFERLRDIKSRFLRSTRPTTVVSRDDYPGLYSGRKRAVYENAVASLQIRAVNRSDAVVRTFVKAEKIKISADKPDPVPRVIQPRTPRYNVEVGRFLKKFEKEMCRGFTRMTTYPVILKCLNATGVATALRDNWKHYKKPVAVGLDASRFDQHVSVEALQFEHSVYNAVFQNPELKELLSWQLYNKGIGYADDGRITYKTTGSRMSGDINTGMGNCLIMCLLVLQYLEDIGLDARLSNNGDDCVLIMESSDLLKTNNVNEWFKDFGFKLTVEDPVYVFERIEFCQNQPVLTGNGYRMTRNPRVAPSKDMVSLLSWKNHVEFGRWRNAIGTCGLELSRGVPFWEAYYKRLWVPHGHGNSTEDIYNSGLGYMARGVAACPITPESRVSFWLAFGLDPDEQVALEEIPVLISYSYLEPLILKDINPLHALLT